MDRGKQLLALPLVEAFALTVNEFSVGIQILLHQGHALFLPIGHEIQIVVHRRYHLDEVVAVLHLQRLVEASPKFVDDQVKRLQLGCQDLSQERDCVLRRERLDLLHFHEVGKDIPWHVLQPDEGRYGEQEIRGKVLRQVHVHELLQFFEILLWNQLRLINRYRGLCNKLNEQIGLRSVKARLRTQALLNQLCLNQLYLAAEGLDLLLRFGEALVSRFETIQRVPLRMQFPEQQ